jgi:predicted nucleotide-binding protein
MSADQPTIVPPRELALFEKLQARLAKGKEFLDRGETPPGQVRMWSGGIRGLIRDIYGEDAPQFRTWPSHELPIDKDRSREVLGERVAMLQHLVDQIAAAGFTSSRGDRIFIGHGRSAAWRELKDFLQDRLHLKCDEFNSAAAAGGTITDRLQRMLDDAGFAFLVMTAEDQHADTSMHARENVVHEIGLFQAHLGLKRAIVLLEEGCTSFSNIQGVVYIWFPKGMIRGCFEEVRATLEREGMVNAVAPR